MVLQLDGDDGRLEDDEPSSQRRCVDCAAVAPRTQTAHTLISSKHGWRLARARVEDGYRFEWRCPKCWAIHKASADHQSRS